MKPVEGHIELVTETLVVHRCGGCNILYAMPQAMLKARRNDGMTFFCPNGCKRVFTETEEDRLREALEQAKRDSETYERWYRSAEADKEHLKQSRAAYIGQVKRLKTRAANGICPCCNRHFTNLERHMKTKHPEFPEPEESV
jgi:hypothetical protein